MSELALTLLRFAFLGLLWVFVLITVWALRRDLRMPADVRPERTTRTRAPKPAKPPRVPRGKKVKGTRLVITEGPLTGTEIPLDGAQITLGRAPDSTIVVDDDYASSRHARIYESEGVWMVEDLGSTNGTWLARARITTPAVIPLNISIRVGRTTLQMQK
ncbi:MAG: FHA domain-containing protein [Actinobacteria bacterium]|nr:FHA domain-containing protein [Actinomycetota bacterium]